jgi:hypothetical protein
MAGIASWVLLRPRNAITPSTHLGHYPRSSTLIVRRLHWSLTPRNFRSLCLILSFSLGSYAQIVPSQPRDPVLPPTPGLLKDTLTATKLSPHQKFQNRVVQQFGLRGVLGTAISAGIGQGYNVPEEWGPHWDGYGKRYASGFGMGITRGAIALGLEGLLHQDPRYFPSSRAGFRNRLRNVFKQVVIAKEDSGHATVAYGRIGSAFGAAFVVNSWQPNGNGGIGDGFERAGLAIVGDAAFFCMQEFIPFTRNSVFRRHR